MSLLDDISYSKSILLSSAPSTCPSSVVFDQDLTLRRMGGYDMRSVRGFICFTVCLEAQYQCRIYNPSIRQLVVLPAIESSHIVAREDPYYIFHSLCHDPVNDRYKLLCTITIMSKDMQMLKSELWVFVLKAGSWKRVAKDFHPHLLTSLEVTMNGVLYYLAWTDLHTCVLVSFDIRSEEFNMIQVPRKAGDVLTLLKKMAILVDYGGKVAVFDYTYLINNGTLDLWVMEDWRKKEWSMKTLALQPSQVHFITRNNWTPKAISLNDNVMWIPQKLTSPFYYFYHDLQINDLKRAEIKGIPNRWFSKPERTRYFDIEYMDPSENMETLFD